MPVSAWDSGLCAYERKYIEIYIQFFIYALFLALFGKLCEKVAQKRSLGPGFDSQDFFSSFASFCENLFREKIKEAARLSGALIIIKGNYLKMTFIAESFYCMFL